MPNGAVIGFGTGPHVTACPPRFTVMPLAATTSGPVQSPLRVVLLVTASHGGGATTTSACGREGDVGSGKSRHATATKLSARTHRAAAAEWTAIVGRRMMVGLVKCERISGSPLPEH